MNTNTNQRCSICNEPQEDTPSGWTCTNGHGGAPAIKDLPLNSLESEDFEYFIEDPDHEMYHVEMKNGQLEINKCEYEYESGPETYALVIEVAKHRGLLS
jgi:hypothetical protein